MKTVANILTQWKFKALANGGIDVAAMLHKCNISNYELNRANGRIPQVQHYSLMLETLKYNDAFLSRQISIDRFYQLFPDLFGLCLNESSAYKAIASFIKYRAIMGDCDICEMKSNHDEIMIEYRNEGPPQLGNGSAVGNFILFRNILREYLPDMSVQAGFVGNPVTTEKVVSDCFQSKCLFNQSTNFLLIGSQSLHERNVFFNERLHRLQKDTAESVCSELKQSKSFSHTITELIESIINSNTAEGDKTIFDDVCNTLKQSRWTINRRLREENTCFTDLLKRVRFNVACRLLAETDKSIQEISDSMFFSSPAIFSRFFSLHANMSPVKYRNRK